MEITLDATEIIEDVVLLIKWPTGIKYTAQADGMGCSHPECEGFVLSLGKYAEDFDDCGMGCCHISTNEQLRQQLANALDSYFILHPHNYDIRFDFDRINELMEGWWPVIVNAELGDSFMKKTSPGPFKGYIHIGNCD